MYIGTYSTCGLKPITSLLIKCTLERTDLLTKYLIYYKLCVLIYQLAYSGLSKPQHQFIYVGGVPLNMFLPPLKGGNPTPNTAPTSPSTGVLRMPSCKQKIASLTNRDTNLN